MEKDYEKIEKLIKLRREYSSRLRPVESSIEQERQGLDESDQEIMAGEWLSRRLDAGLFALQVWNQCTQSNLLIRLTITFRLLMSFLHGSLPKMMGQRPK
jgi:hypothetical protein